MFSCRAALLLVGAAGVTLLLSCCTHSTPVEPDYSGFAVDSVYYKCGKWFPAPPEQSRGLFDVFLSHNPRAGGPTAEQRALVEAVGGTIVYEYRIPVVRALLEAADLPLLEKYARGVTDLEDYPVRLALWFKSAITQEDRDYLISLGAEDIREIPSAPKLMGVVVPDQTVSSVLTWDRLVVVESNENTSCPLKPNR